MQDGILNEQLSETVASKMNRAYLLLFVVIGFASSENPCESVIDISSPKRAPEYTNFLEGVELCDSELKKDRWYFLGGKISDSCIDINRCSTFAGIWYDGKYPTGNEIITGKVCAKLGMNMDCCAWSGIIKIKRCEGRYIYQLAVPDDCPMSYCVGESIPCSTDQVLNKNNGVCYDIPQLQKPELGAPYISGFKMFKGFNATTFSVDCHLKAIPVDPEYDIEVDGQLKVETMFRMNDEEVASYISDYPVDKVTLKESKLAGHIGKTLTCEAQMFYEFDDGTKSSTVKSERSVGFFFGIEATDCNGAAMKEITMKQGVPIDIYLRSTFPITFDHCFRSNQCQLRKYAFTVALKDDEVQQSDCQIQFENPHGNLVYKSSTPISIMADTTPGEEHSKDLLVFKTFDHLAENESLFKKYVISPIQVNTNEVLKQPTCYSVGDPHFSTFNDAKFDNYYSGDFNLLSTKHRTFEIQVRQVPCLNAKVTCNCGIIAREGNNIIGINACDHKATPTVFQLMRDDKNPTASIKTIKGEYFINFVSGIIIKVGVYRRNEKSLLNIYVNGLKHEDYEGICSATVVPADFNIYRVPYERSFFKQELPSCVNEIFKFPYCKCVKGPKNVSVKCRSENDRNTEIVGFKDICPGIKREKRDAYGRTVSPAGKTRSNNQRLEDIFGHIDHAIDNITFSINEAMPENEATNHCLAILENVRFSNVCIEFLGDKHDVLQHNCVEDVKLTGNAEIAQIYLNIYEEVCMTTLAKEVTIVDGEMSLDNNTIIEILEEMDYTFPGMKSNEPSTKDEPADFKWSFPKYKISRNYDKPIFPKRSLRFKNPKFVRKTMPSRHRKVKKVNNGVFKIRSPRFA